VATKKEVVARKCYEVCKRALPKYSRRGLKKYEFWRLIAMFLYGIIYNLTYRDLEEEFLVSEVLRKALNLKELPHYSTICKAVKEVEGRGFEKVVRRELQIIECKVRSLGNRFQIKRGQCELLLCEGEWKEKEELD